MPDAPKTTEVVVELTDVGGRTRLVLTHRGVAADSPGAAGWTMAFDKLAARVAAGAGRQPGQAAGVRAGVAKPLVTVVSPSRPTMTAS